MSVIVVALLALAAAARGQQISVQPAVVAASGDEVTIAWSGVNHASAALDRVQLLWGGEAAPFFSVGYINITHAPTWESGSGSVKIPIRNIRVSPLRWAYARNNGSGTYTQLAVSNGVVFAAAAEPTGVHLSSTGAGGEMRVMWSTGSNVATSPPQLVQFGLSASALTEEAVAESSTYTADAMCGPPANQTGWFTGPGSINDAVMSPLKADTRYYYRVGSKSTGWSKVFSFRTPLPQAEAAHEGEETRVIVFGDMGISLPFLTLPTQQSPAEHVLRWMKADLTRFFSANSSGLVLNIGDIAYARGWAYVWEEYLAAVQPLAATMPWMTVPGNHEMDWIGTSQLPAWAGLRNDDSGGECGVPYMYRFHMPDVVGGVRNMWWAAEHGVIRVVGMSTEHDYTIGSPQYRFLAAALAATNRTRTPWLVFVTHRPVYSSAGGHDTDVGTDRGDTNDHLRGILEPLLVKYGVDVVFSGHVHAYERTCGVHKFICADKDEDAPVHIIVGSSGNVYQPNWANSLLGTADWRRFNSKHHSQPDWSIFRTMNFGYGRFVATPKQLTFQFVGAKRGDIHDSVTLNK